MKRQRLLAPCLFGSSRKRFSLLAASVLVHVFLPRSGNVHRLSALSIYFSLSKSRQPRSVKRDPSSSMILPRKYNPISSLITTSGYPVQMFVIFRPTAPRSQMASSCPPFVFDPPFAQTQIPFPFFPSRFSRYFHNSRLDPVDNL